MGRDKFLELLLKKPENVERFKWIEMIKNLIHSKSKEDAQKKNVMELLEDGEKEAEKDIHLVNVDFNVNKYLVSSLTFGTKSQYEYSRNLIETFSQIKCPSTGQSEILGKYEMAAEEAVEAGACSEGFNS